MQLLIVRHAIAEEREAFASSGRPDSERPLTEFGVQRMRRNARGIQRVAPSRVTVLASPYARALRTAELLCEALEVDPPVTLDALTPERHPREALEWLAKQPDDARIAMVGHEPHLSRLISWCIAAVDASRAELKKGAAALIEFDGAPQPGEGTLRWLLQPTHLRTIAD